MNQTTQDIDLLLERSISALEDEIKTVQEFPSSDQLREGKRESESESKGETDYTFETLQPSIRFAEEITALQGEKEWTVIPVSYEKNKVTLRFPENLGETIGEIDVEWENDFVLKRTLRVIERLETADTSVRDRIRLLFEPEETPVPGTGTVRDDGNRNKAQRSAIEKAMKSRTLFIWGPPGTGKTSTLGFIAANYLAAGKRVLLASNTNRAVDVGLLSTLEAIHKIGLDIDNGQLTRFGDPALDLETLDEVMFDRQIEEVIRERQAKAAEGSGLLARLSEVKTAAEERMRDGKQPTGKQKQELELIERKIKHEGGREKLEAKLEELLHVNERFELKKRQLVATTLAKVCTSDLFFDMDFDAVVIDEGSMANLPYLIALSGKAKWHRVVVGDPMQLPPIAVTENKQSREFLEQDIFTTVSEAETTAELFSWHDRNPEFTCFFDIQYRLEPSLADLISTVFYDGRLRSDTLPDEAEGYSDDLAFHLVDTSKYNPVLTQKANRTGERGFQPVNEVHEELILRLVGKLQNKGVRQEEIGVMVPFRSTVYALRNRLNETGYRDVEVGTIHTFQGREKPYILFDTVMSGEMRNGSPRHYSVRPLDEEKNGLSVPRLLNVAFSRSQKELVILADMRHIENVYSGKFVGKLLNRMKG